MAYNEELAERLRETLAKKRGITEKKMFGGITFMCNGNMTCGVEKDNVVMRVGPDAYENALKRKHVRPMDFTGRPLKGMVYVDKAGIKSDTSLKEWVDLCLKFTRSLPKK